MADCRLLIFSEFAVVIIVWTGVFLLPVSLSVRVLQALPEIWRDGSIELRLIASSMTVMLGMYLERVHQGLFQGMGVGEETSRTWSGLLHAGALSLAQLFGYLDTHSLTRISLLHASIKELFRSVEAWINPHPGLRERLCSPDAGLLRYKYKDLSGSKAIRVITLESPISKLKTAAISCHMKEIYLDSDAPFTALSYAWDSHHGTERIICDGGYISVTKNCVAALRNIRDHPSCKNKLLWVDAICINQDETATEEKGRQIGIMGEIYTRASEVRVWLGEHDRSSKVVCEFLDKVSKAYDRSRRYRNIDHAVQAAEEAGLDNARRWPQLSTSLADFFCRSWFTRAWPVQEVTLPLPGRVTVVCGWTQLKFEHLRFGWGILRKLGVLPMSANLDQAVALQFYLADAITLKRNLPPAEYPDIGRPLLPDLSQFSFTSVMNAMRFKACRDPKDRFFSLYGVFQELDIAHDIPISMWSQTDAHVFKAVTLACFKLDGNLNAIRLAQLSDPRITIPASQTTSCLPRDATPMMAS
ncbi:hypothetical protein DL770_001994 [Monosporascus sp. CRB-9-2]|nr:hypothetical protein DL770_001994 [Monosporascus sp. CRB-9-2]